MRLKPAAPQPVPNEKLRESLLQQRKVLSYLSVGLFVGIGFYRIGDGFGLFSSIHISNVLLAVLTVVAFAVIFRYMMRIARYDLNPKDEYEKLQDYKAKAKAFDVLNFGIILIVLALNQRGRLSVDGLLLTLVGIGLFITTRTNAQ